MFCAKPALIPFETIRRLIPDGKESVRSALISLCDEEEVDLVLTTGGTGPSPRDETPEGTRAVLDKELPGFGEQLRQAGLAQTPTAILSRQLAGVRGRALIVNLPGRPASIRLSLNAVFPSIPYCLDLIGAGHIETDPSRIVSFRPSITDGSRSRRSFACYSSAMALRSTSGISGGDDGWRRRI